MYSFLKKRYIVADAFCGTLMRLNSIFVFDNGGDHTEEVWVGGDRHFPRHYRSAITFLVTYNVRSVVVEFLD